jgi:hypothetical protein
MTCGEPFLICYPPRGGFMRALRFPGRGARAPRGRPIAEIRREMESHRAVHTPFPRAIALSSFVLALQANRTSSRAVAPGSFVVARSAHVIMFKRKTAQWSADGSFEERRLQNPGEPKKFLKPASKS